MAETGICPQVCLTDLCGGRLILNRPPTLYNIGDFTAQIAQKKEGVGGLFGHEGNLQKVHKFLL